MTSPSGSPDPVAPPVADIPGAHRRALGFLTRPTIGSDVVVLVLAAALVQLAFPHRSDWPAHLAAGGGVLLLAAAALPSGWGRGGRAIGPVGVVVVGGLGLVTEVLWFGPFDALDVALTAAGALLVADVASEVAASGRDERRRAAAWGAGLVVASLGYRFGVDPLRR